MAAAEKKVTRDHLRFLQEHPRFLDHKCRLELNNPVTHRCLTTIMATVSRNSRSEEVLLEMLRSGMRVARLNMCHHSHDYHSDTIQLLRKTLLAYDAETGYFNGLAIALELRGPQIHTGFLECDDDIQVEAGDRFRLSTNKDLFYMGNKHFIYVGYPNIASFLLPGHRVVIDDGEISLMIREINGDNIFCDVMKGGMLKPNKVIKFPDTQLDLPNVTEKDRFDIQFAIDQNVDFIIAPQIRCAGSVFEIRNILGKKGAHMMVIAKIEHKESLANIDEIIAASDGILFARADLSLEIPMIKLVTAQKGILARCQKAGKPFIIANCILKSMVYSKQPTCSELIELGCAITEGIDCVMLTTATGVGKYPVESIQMTSKICREAELATWHKAFYDGLVPTDITDANYTTAITAVSMAKNSMAAGIIVLTTTGRSANLVSRYRPRCPIFAITKCAYTNRRVKLFRGVIPIYFTGTVANDDDMAWSDKVDARLEYALWVGNKMGFIKTSDTVVIVGPWKMGGGFTNNCRLIYAFFENDFKLPKKERKTKEEKVKPSNYCCRRCRL